MTKLCAYTGWNYGEAWLPDGEPTVLRRSRAGHAESESAEFARASANYVFQTDEGLPGLVWRSGQTEWVPDFSAPDRYPRSTLAAKLGLHTALGVPVLADSAIVAILAFHMKSSERPSDSLVELVSMIGAQIGPMIRGRRARDELTRQLSVTSGVLHSAMDGIYVKDVSGKYTMINPAGARLAGLTIDEVLGRTDEEIFPAPTGAAIR